MHLICRIDYRQYLVCPGIDRLYCLTEVGVFHSYTSEEIGKAIECLLKDPFLKSKKNFHFEVHPEEKIG